MEERRGEGEQKKGEKKRRGKRGERGRTIRNNNNNYYNNRLATSIPDYQWARSVSLILSVPLPSLNFLIPLMSPLMSSISTSLLNNDVLFSLLPLPSSLSLPLFFLPLPFSFSLALFLHSLSLLLAYLLLSYSLSYSLPISFY